MLCDEYISIQNLNFFLRKRDSFWDFFFFLQNQYLISSAYRKYDVINIIHEDELWNKVPNSLKNERYKGFKLITIEVFFYGFGPNIEVNLGWDYGKPHV